METRTPGMMQKWISKLWPFAALAGCLVFFYHEFMAGKVFGWDDDLFVFFPGARYFATSIKSGVFPFWLPGLRSGMPFYSDVQMGVFYPLKWLLVLLVKDGELPQQAYQCYLVFQYMVAGALFYGLMRMHKAARVAAATGALVYCFSGFSALHIVFFASIEVMVWLPLVLMAIHYYFQGRCLFRVLLVSLAVLLTFLPGFPQVTVYVAYFSMAYWLVLAACREYEGKTSWKGFSLGLLRELGIVAGTYLVAFAMGAVLLFPGFENWRLSSRAAYGYDQVADSSMPFYYVVNMFFPNFTGVMKPAGDAVQYWGFNRDTIGFRQYNTAYWHYWDFGCYAGQIGMVSLLYSLAFIRSHWKTPFRWICAIAAVMAFWFMLGRYGGLFRVLYEILPGISAFRSPCRMSSVFNAAQAVLAAYFVSDLVRGVDLRRIRGFLMIVLGGYAVFLVVFLVGGKGWCEALGNEQVFRHSLRQILAGIGFAGVLAAVAFLAGRESLKKFQGLVFSILFLSVFLDLYAAHGRFHRGDQKAADYFGDRGQLISRLQAFQQQNGICRFAQLRNGRISEEVVTPRNIGYMQEIEVPEGYVLFNLMSIARVRKNLPEETVRDLLNIGIIAEQTAQGVGLQVRKEMMPRAVFYSEVAPFATRDELFAALASGAVDHRTRVAVLEADVAGLRFAAAAPPAKCDARKVNNNQWNISCGNQGPGIVFVSQSYYPGWKARDAGGTEYPVIETFGGLTGIVVPEGGGGEILFTFSPSVFFAGALVSAISMGVVAGILVFHAWRGKKAALENE